MSSIFWSSWSLSVTVWSPGFWLPPGLQWENFKEDSHVNKSIIGTNKYARPMDLLYPIPMALVMIMARIVMEKVIFKQLGQTLCLSSCRQPRPVENRILEKSYQGGNPLDSRELARRTGMTCQQVMFSCCLRW